MSTVLFTPLPCPPALWWYILYFSGSQSVVPRQVSSASPGTCQKCTFLSPTTDLHNLCWWDPVICVLKNPSGDSHDLQDPASTTLRKKRQRPLQEVAATVGGQNFLWSSTWIALSPKRGSARPTSPVPQSSHPASHLAWASSTNPGRSRGHQRTT